MHFLPSIVPCMHLKARSGLAKKVTFTVMEILYMDLRSVTVSHRPLTRRMSKALLAMMPSDLQRMTTERVTTEHHAG
jgi:hypothetical protein